MHWSFTIYIIIKIIIWAIKRVDYKWKINSFYLLCEKDYTVALEFFIRCMYRRKQEFYLSSEMTSLLCHGKNKPVSSMLNTILGIADVHVLNMQVLETWLKQIFSLDNTTALSINNRYDVNR
jgi:hypothetical protein